MCTAILFQHHFGRTLDLECSYGEEVVITPRQYPFVFRHGGEIRRHAALIGMAHVTDGYPLYYDAVNEHGLAMAALNFVGYARYGKPKPELKNLAQFELIPYLLGNCTCLDQVQERLQKLFITDTPFSTALPVSSLHWMIADKTGALVLESTESGVQIYKNPTGVLTNSPPFDWQMTHLNQYMQVSAQPPQNRFAPDLILSPFSRGMGAWGLPGDLSSSSRFVRAAFARGNALPGSTPTESLGQFFHLLDTIGQVKGCCRLDSGEQEYTLYGSCMDLDRGLYFYTTYHNRRITQVDMHACDLADTEIMRYPLVTKEDIFRQN